MPLPTSRSGIPIASAIGLFRSKWFTIGMLVAVVAWVFHVAALALAPLSLVQAVISGGLVFLTVIAERCFGYTVGKRQWAGVGLTALGLVLLAATLPSGEGAHSSYSLAAMIAFESGLLAVGTFLVLSPQLGLARASRRDARRRGGHPLRSLRRRDQGAHRTGGRRGHRRADLALAR